MTLVEVMVASFLLALFIGGVYTGLITGMRMNYATAQRLAAFGLCAERLEQMRGCDYSTITVNNFPTETNKLTHLGGSQRVPLNCIRSNIIVSLSNPARKAIAIKVNWVYRGKDYNESINGTIFFKEESASPVFRGAIDGWVNINPNNSSDNEFSVETPGGTINRDDLTQDSAGYYGPATLVHVKPKGNGNQNNLTMNGELFTLFNSSTYDIAADDMTVWIKNDKINPQGKAIGKWWIWISSGDGTLTIN
jgi:hypothetical protein